MEPSPADHEIVSSEVLMAPVSPTSNPMDMENPPKLKSRQRLLQSLQRMSSSPSLNRLARSSSSYNGNSRASLSCASLASPAPSFVPLYEISSPSPFSPASSAGFSTAPTSAVGTPPPEMRFSDLKDRLRLHQRNCSHESKGPSTVPLPSSVQFSSMSAALASAPEISEQPQDYFSISEVTPPRLQKRPNFNFWKDLPPELRFEILQHLTPKEIIRCSAVSRAWHSMCFDGQLWASLDATAFYREIPAETLVKIMTSAGPFMRDLNLRGCAQMFERWASDSQKITEVCRNIEYFSIDGCKIDRTSVHYFLLRNPGLVHVNLSGCGILNNSAMKILAQSCPALEYLNVSWCTHIDTKGLQRVVQGCRRLKDLRASEVKGWNDESFLMDLFEQNRLERLLISHCSDFDNNALAILLQGKNPDIDVLTGRPNVSPRSFRHLDFHRCRQLANSSVKFLAHNTPRLAGLRLSQCTSIGDDAIIPIVETCPELTHLDFEELDLTNASLTALAKSDCAARLYHLNISYCESLGDTGMIPVLKTCQALRSVEMDNTRISDLTLVEAAAQVRQRNRAATEGNLSGKPELGLSVVAYDCSHVTWTGVREILSRNAEFYRRPVNSMAPSYPKEIISLKCFYGYQPTVREHTKRVLQGELARATLLERKWADYMVATEEAGMTGSGVRRRRRRAREAERAHADEQDEYLGRGGRRRARSGGCAIM